MAQAFSCPHMLWHLKVESQTATENDLIFKGQTPTSVSETDDMQMRQTLKYLLSKV